MPTPIELLDTAMDRFDDKAKEAHRYNDEWIVATLPYLRTLLSKSKTSLERGNVNPETLIALAIAEQIVEKTND